MSTLELLESFSGPQLTTSRVSEAVGAHGPRPGRPEHSGDARDGRARAAEERGKGRRVLGGWGQGSTLCAGTRGRRGGGVGPRLGGAPLIPCARAWADTDPSALDLHESQEALSFSVSKIHIPHLNCRTRLVTRSPTLP